MEWGRELGKYKSRALDSTVDELIRLYKDLGDVLGSADWSELSSFSDDLASLFNDLVDTCPEMLGRQFLSLLELLASKYSVEVSSNELTFIHVALAAHCWKHKFLECEFLKLYSTESKLLVPLAAEDVALYFENCYFLCAHTRRWTDAATHAALAFSLHASLQRFRHWCLAELIANGRVAALPRAVSPAVSCPVIAEFSRCFERTESQHWIDLIKFCRHHEAAFEEWGVAQLARRAVITYCLLRIRKVLAHVVRCRAHELLDVYDQEGISLHELINAGLGDFCQIDNNRVASVMERKEEPEQAKQWLQLSAQLSEQLQTEVYRT